MGPFSDSNLADTSEENPTSTSSGSDCDTSLVKWDYFSYEKCVIYDTASTLIKSNWKCDRACWNEIYRSSPSGWTRNVPHLNKISSASHLNPVKNFYLPCLKEKKLSIENFEMQMAQDTNLNLIEIKAIGPTVTTRSTQ